MIELKGLKGLKGKITINKVRKDGTRYDFREVKNLFIDDGKEYVLDFLGGLKTWHNPQTTYTSGMVDLWNTSRYIGIGRCMFNNKCLERAKGQNGILTGTESSYPVSETLLVSPEDSFLSNEVGTRRLATVTRRDQTLELYARFEVPSNIAVGTKIREFGYFLGLTGPTNDPSYSDTDKPKTMICRSALYGSGIIGGTGVYSDNPLIANDDVELRWKFGEL